MTLLDLTNATRAELVAHYGLSVDRFARLMSDAAQEQENAESADDKPAPSPQNYTKD